LIEFEGKNKQLNHDWSKRHSAQVAQLRNCAKGIKKITRIETDSTDWALNLL